MAGFRSVQCPTALSAIILFTAGILSASPLFAECRAPEACLSCHEAIGHLDEEEILAAAEGSCDVGDFVRGFNMTRPRFIHRATELQDGRVLLTGGATKIWEITNTVDIYDPSDNSITPAAPMTVRRWSHTATALSDGRVLVVGGRTHISPFFGGEVLATAEIYDPATDTWTQTPGDLNVPRRSHSATLLPDGRVLIVGGGDSASTSSSLPIGEVEVFDPATGMFTVVGSLLTPRKAHSAVLLNDGTVLIAGGSSGKGNLFPTTSAEIYDPITNTSTEVGPMNFPHLAQNGAKMRDGRVLLAGSFDNPDHEGSGIITEDSEIYDPISQTFTVVDPMTMPRIDIGGLLLLDGTVLVAGGVATGDFPTVFHSSSEVFDPFENQWHVSGLMSTGRDEFSGLVLDNGRVLISGGFNLDPGPTLLDTIEIYTPGLVPQLHGLQNVVGDLPASAFRWGEFTRSLLLFTYSAMEERLAHGDPVRAMRAVLRWNRGLNRLMRYFIVDRDARRHLRSVSAVLTDTLKLKINPNEAPMVAADATPASGTEPLTVSFTGASSDPDGSISSTVWRFGDGSTSNELNPVHTYQCDGQYNATVQVADNQGAVASDSVTIDVSSAGGPITYDCDVQPVFDRVCTGCHGSSGGLSLQSCDTLLAGSDHGPVIDPGSKETSHLWQEIDSGGMPLVGGRLPQAEIDNIGAWIDSLDPADPNFCD